MKEPETKAGVRTRKLRNQAAAAQTKKQPAAQRKPKRHTVLYSIIGVLILFCIFLVGVNLFLLISVIPSLQNSTSLHKSAGKSALPEQKSLVPPADVLQHPQQPENTPSEYIRAGTGGIRPTNPDSVQHIPSAKAEGQQLPPAYRLADQGRYLAMGKPLLPETLPAKPAAPQYSATLIFVFDDAGHSLDQLDYFLRLPFPCTIAVLPRLRYSAESARRIRKAGKEVMLHQPMQAVNPSIDPGPGAIQPQHTQDEIKAIVRKNLAELWPVAGMNNHEGSLITADPRAVNAVLDIAGEYNIFFLDSRTTAKTVVPQVAKKRNMRIWERAVFIDNEKSRAAMEKQIKKGAHIAQKHGYAIMIGHIATIELALLLQELYPVYAARGFSFSTITQIAQRGV